MPSTTPPATPGCPPRPRDAAGLPAFNAAPAEVCVLALMECCGVRRWAATVARHRPYPTLEALLAAGDEACYDLGAGELAEALTAERFTRPAGGGSAAWTALTAAREAYQERFGYPFLLALDGAASGEPITLALAALRSRLGNEPDEERQVAAEQLRRLARERLRTLAARFVPLGG